MGHPYIYGKWGKARRPAVGEPLAPMAPDGVGVRLAIVRAAWAYISAHPRASTREVARGIGVRTVSTAARALRILEDAGYIRRPVTPARRSLGRVYVVVVPLMEARP